MAVKLYFDQVSNGGAHGKTNNGDKILYNLNAIDPKKAEEYTDMLFRQDKATIFYYAGRFLIIVTASLEMKEKFMVAFDLNDNEDSAKRSFKNDPNEKELMSLFYKMRENIKQDYDKFVLVEGKSPNQDFK